MLFFRRDEMRLWVLFTSDQCCCPRALVLVSGRLETGICRSWSWSLSWKGVMNYWLCFITYSLDQTVCWRWRSQRLLTNVHNWGHIGGYTLQFTLCTYLFTFFCNYKMRQHRCKVVGASHIKQTVPATACAVSENFPHVEWVFSSSGLLMRPHRARMSDQLLSQLVFLTCNKHVEFDWTQTAVKT